MMRALRAFAFLLAIILWPHEVWGCSCGGWPSVQEARQRAAGVLDGVVVKKAPVLMRSEGTWLVVERWTFAVHQSWKGAFPAITVSQGNSNCSRIYTLGQRALVYAYPHEALESDLQTHSCKTPVGPRENHLASLGAPLRTAPLPHVNTEPRAARVIRHLQVYGLIAIALVLNVVSMDEYNPWFIDGASILSLGIIAFGGLLSGILSRRYRRPLLIAFVFVVAALIGATFWAGQRYLSTPYLGHLVERD